MSCRGVRGAITVEDNTKEEILRGARQLLALMIRQNGIDPGDVASAIFSCTHDLDAEFPALAARQLGWLDVPLLCTNEIDVPGSLQKCVRILINWNTPKTQDEIVHVYVKDAVRLRPDLSKLPPVDLFLYKIIEFGMMIQVDFRVLANSMEKGCRSAAPGTSDDECGQRHLYTLDIVSMRSHWHHRCIQKGPKN